jgi:hypothetical protein
MPSGDGASAMIRTGAAALLLLLFGGDQERPAGSGAAQGTVNVRHRQIVIRVPSAFPQPPGGESLVKWREGRGPDCIAAGRVIGATLMRENSVDLILRDRSRVRLRLQRRCPALAYYRGFYVNATADGRICADRDSIRSRAGGECVIDAFRSLSPDRP